VRWRRHAERLRTVDEHRACQRARRALLNFVGVMITPYRAPGVVAPVAGDVADDRLASVMRARYVRAWRRLVEIRRDRVKFTLAYLCNAVFLIVCALVMQTFSPLLLPLIVGAHPALLAAAITHGEIACPGCGKDFERWIFKHPFAKRCQWCGLAVNSIAPVGARRVRVAEPALVAAANVAEEDSSPRLALQPDPRQPPV
jgi:hypothetical protein